MLHVFSPVKSPRLSYIVHWIFSRFPDLDYTLTYDPEILNSDHPVLAYTRDAPVKRKNIFFVPSGGLLFARGREAEVPQVQFKPIPKELADADTPEVFQQNGFPFLFGSREEDQGTGERQLDFDPFSACFYWISRMEEYGDEALRDKHGRYMAQNSLLHKLGSLEYPLADAYVYLLVCRLRKELQLKFSDPEFEWVPTLDIDRPFASRALSLGRMLRRTGFCLQHRQFRELWKDWMAWLGWGKDRLDFWSGFEAAMRVAGKEPFIFFLVRGQPPYDLNYQWQTLAFENLLRQVDQWAHVGIHPSYQSWDAPRLMGREINRLKRILKRPIESSRQHYLRFELPETYAQLAHQGIKREFSMGYAANPGFRAATCHPFYWYDLSMEQITALKVYPLMAMDTTYTTYMHREPREVLKPLLGLTRRVKFFGGKAVTLWHNESLSDFTGWKGWSSLHQQYMKEVVHLENS